MIQAHVIAASEVEDGEGVVVGVDVVLRVYLDEIDDDVLAEITGKVGAGPVGIAVEDGRSRGVLTLNGGDDAAEAES